MSEEIKGIGAIIKRIQNRSENKPTWQSSVLRVAWKKIFVSTSQSLVRLYIREQKLFVKTQSHTLKHYITTNHDMVLAKLNHYAGEISKAWLNLDKIVLLHY